MKHAEMLVVSPRGVNYGFWYHLGCWQYFGPLEYLLGLRAKKQEKSRLAVLVDYTHQI